MSFVIAPLSDNHGNSAGEPRVLSPSAPRFRRKDGYLSGSYPDGITKVEGVPGPATIRVLHRPPSGGYADGLLIAEVVSGPDGTWRVDGLDPALRYDVVCRLEGYQDMILSNVTPATD